MSTVKKETPVMKQFRDAKKSHPDSIMLFRMGDFYETFEKDAIIASEISKSPLYIPKFKSKIPNV